MTVSEQGASSGLERALQEAHFRQASAIERLMEHEFLSELIQAALAEGRGFPTVLRAETDTNGYDVVLGCGGVTRWVQLKASARMVRAQPLNIGLTRQPSGCVVWLVYSVDDHGCISFHFGWLGNGPGEPMDDLPGAPAKGRANAQGHKGVRPTVKLVSYGKFERVDTMEDLLVKLFGPLERPVDGLDGLDSTA